jgi:CheY-like chemotaxis protein
MEKARILAVDGDPLVRRLVEIVLTADGFEVDVAADAVEARAFLHRGGPPDLFLTDLEKPVDPGKLRETVRTVIARRSRLRETAGQPGFTQLSEQAG